MVDVQHGALRAFKQYRLPFIQRVVHKFGGIADVATNFFAQLQRFVDFVREIDVRAISAFRQAIFLCHYTRGFFAEQRRIEQVAHAQSTARHFVFIRRSDATRSGADLICAARAFRGFIEFAMVRKNQMSAIADVQAAGHVHARLAESLDFVDQRAGINHHAHANDGVLFRPQNSARNQLENVLVLADDDGMPGIMAASHANDEIE